MNAKLRITAAAAIALGGCAYFAPTALGDDVTVKTKTETVQTNQKSADLSFPAGITVKDLKEKGDVRDALKGVTESAVTKDGIKSLVSHRLVDADRKRIGKLSGLDLSKLDGRIDQFRKDWKSKYGQDFKIDENKAFSDQFVSILQGEVSDPQALVGHWPVPVTEGYAMAGGLGDNAQTAGAKIDTSKQQHDANKTFGGQTNLEKGRNVALMYIPASHGAPDLKLSLIHELPDIWRFDIPDNIDGPKLYDNLLTHLTWVDEHRDQWPGDVNDAYRMVAHHVAMALYDVPMHAHGNSH